jgi:hypothetical protein
MTASEHGQPVACTLVGQELADRIATWQRLAQDFLRYQEDVPGGVALTYASASGVEETVRNLAELEAECCSWATWRVEALPDGVRLDVTAPGDREQVLRSMFARR